MEITIGIFSRTIKGELELLVKNTNSGEKNISKELSRLNELHHFTRRLRSLCRWISALLSCTSGNLLNQNIQQ
jgi:hypothetical protein